MDQRSFSYALITALYDEGQDYLDAFWPFAIRVLPDRGRVDRGTIRAKLEGQYGLPVPDNVLRLLLYRAMKRGLLRRTTAKHLIELTDEGRSWRAGLETDREVERRINELVAAGVTYFARNGRDIEHEAFNSRLVSFVQANLEPLLEYVGAATCRGTLCRGNGEEDKLLVRFVAHCESSEPTLFATLQDMVRGSILSAVLCSDRAEDLQDLKDASFSQLRVYLDTNVLLAVLGLEAVEAVAAAHEVMGLLAIAHCEVRVFPFTVDEVCGFLAAFDERSQDLAYDAAAGSAVGAMKRAGMRRSDVARLIGQIEERIRSAGVEIDTAPDIDLATYVPRDPAVRAAVRRFKSGDSRIERHDVAAIEAIREARGGRRCRRLQEATALFLSSDVRLSRASFEGLGHKRSGTIAEVIHDDVLASVLWLRSPSSAPPLKMIVAAYSHNLFVDRRVWERFVQVVQELRRRGEVSEDEVADLLYRDYIAAVLMDVGQDSIEEVDAALVMRGIHEARAAREAREAQAVQTEERLKTEFEARLQSSRSQLDQSWKARISAAITAAEDDCLRSAKKLTLCVCLGVSAALLALIGFVVWSIACVPDRSATELALEHTLGMLAPPSLIVALWKVRPALTAATWRRLTRRNPVRAMLATMLEGAPCQDQALDLVQRGH